MSVVDEGVGKIRLVGARCNEGAAIAWSYIFEGERNIDIATEEIVVVIDETGAVFLSCPPA